MPGKEAPSLVLGIGTRGNCATLSSLQPFSGDVVADRKSVRTQVAQKAGKAETSAKASP